jgi:hypothetical protein
MPVCPFLVLELLSFSSSLDHVLVEGRGGGGGQEGANIFVKFIRWDVRLFCPPPGASVRAGENSNRVFLN